MLLLCGGSQVSCPLQEVTAHSAGLGALQGAGLAGSGWAGAGDHPPAGGKVADQAGPVASSLVWAEGPSLLLSVPAFSPSPGFW